MITYHNGDLLESGCNIICHQVNLQGIMGGGIALQIARKYPKCEKEYVKYVKEENPTTGAATLYLIDSSHLIVNCFTQDENFNTDYKALRDVLEQIKVIFPDFYTVGIPYKYGCGIANGDWNIVEGIIKDAFEKSDMKCQIWKFREV